MAVLKETNPARMLEICSKGGRTAHQLGRAHQYNREEALAAAQKSKEVRAARRAALQVA